eukprot:2391374-Rhodomonas_salina.1
MSGAEMPIMPAAPRRRKSVHEMRTVDSIGPVPRRKASAFALDAPPPGILFHAEGSSDGSAIRTAGTGQPRASSPQSRQRRFRSSQGSDAMAMLWNNLDERRLSQVIGTEYSKTGVTKEMSRTGMLQKLIGPIQVGVLSRDDDATATAFLFHDRGVAIS